MFIQPPPSHLTLFRTIKADHVRTITAVENNDGDMVCMCYNVYTLHPQEKKDLIIREDGTDEVFGTFDDPSTDMRTLLCNLLMYQ